MRKIKLCLSFAGAALLVACATEPTAPTQGQTPGQKFEVPIGYQKTTVNGVAVYCRTNVETGSHIAQSKVCYTMAQLQAEAAETQTNIQNQINNSNGLGTAVGAGGPSNGR